MIPGRLQDWCEVLTLTWMHSLWQGALVGIAVAVLLVVLGRASSAVRYAVALIGLCVLAGTVLVTGIMMAQQMAPEPVAEVSIRATEVSEQVIVTVTEMSEAVPAYLRPEGPVLHSVAPLAGSSTEDRLEPELPTPGVWLRIRDLALAWAPWIVGLWMGGVALLALRFGAGWVELWRLRREGLRPVSVVIQAQLEGLSRSLGVRAAVKVLESTRALTPIIIGWTKPLILLPAGMVSGLSSQQLEAILLHELAHIRRHDFLTNVVQRVIETVLFYHPAVWYLSSRVRTAREHCCDDLAAEACGDRLGYASVLALIEEFRQSNDLALAIGQKPLVKRIHRLLEPRTNRPLPTAAFVGILVTGLAAMIAWWPSSTTAQDTQTDVDAVPRVDGAEVSLYAVADSAKDQDLWRVDFRQGKEIGREMIMKLRESVWNRGFQVYQNRYAISEAGAVIDLEKRRVLRRANGRLVGLIDDQVYCWSDRRVSSQLAAFDLNTLTEQSILPIGRGGGLLSPQGDWWLDRMHGTGKAPKLIRLADELTLNCPIEPVYYANPLSSIHSGAAMLWLDNETVLIGATNTDWITMNVFGDVEEIVTIPALDHARWWKDNPRLGPHRLFRDPLGTVVYEAERAFAIDVEAKEWRPYDWHQLGYGFAAKPETCHWERAEFRYEAESIGFSVARQREAIADHLAVTGRAENSYADTKISCWSTHTRMWTDLGLKYAHVIGWVDHRTPPTLKVPVETEGESPREPLVVRDWGAYVLGQGEEDRRHSIHVYGGNEGMKLNVELGAGAKSWELTMHESAQALSKDTESPELRQVPCRYLRTGTSEERFLSYQAPKPNARSATVSVREDGVHFMLPHPVGEDSAEPRSALAIINEDGQYRIAVEWMFGVQTEILMSKGRFREVDREGVLKSARQLWRYMGATSAEALAFVKSCEVELLGTPGLLSVYPKTQKQVEADLSLSVEPVPTEIYRRVMILEALAWKPVQSR